MAVASTFCSHPYLLHKNYVVSSPRNRFSSSSYQSSLLFGSKVSNNWLSFIHKTRPNRPELITCSVFNPPSSSSQTFDVVIIGAGIIGLTIARQFLLGSDLSVAVVDKSVPCSGATGAGAFFPFQFYGYPYLLFGS